MAQTTQAAQSTAPAPLPLHAIDVDGQRLEYADVSEAGSSSTGSGARNTDPRPVVVLVHGGNCTADDWAGGPQGAIVAQLAQRYRLILPDGLVHPLDPWRIWLLLDQLGIEDATLVGHSAGGPVVVMMYRLQPHRVRGLVAIDTVAVGATIMARLLPNDRFSPHAAALYEQHREEMARLKPQHQGDYPSEVNIAHRLVAYERARMTPEERARSRPAPRSVRTIVNAPPAPEPIPDTGKFIGCPLLVFDTGRGKVGPEDVSKAWIAENIRATDVEYVVIRESSHWPWYELPELFLSRLEPFLARTL